jgi:hypothetical protein
MKNPLTICILMLDTLIQIDTSPMLIWKTYLHSHQLLLIISALCVPKDPKDSSEDSQEEPDSDKSQKSESGKDVAASELTLQRKPLFGGQETSL